MKIHRFSFWLLPDAIATVRRLRAPLLLARFALLPAESVVIAVNGAAAAWPETPAPGEYLDCRRDRHITADIELDYLYYQLLPAADRRRPALRAEDQAGDDSRRRRNVWFRGGKAKIGPLPFSLTKSGVRSLAPHQPSRSMPLTATSVTGPGPAHAFTVAVSAHAGNDR